jgi:hypothetical protein
VKQPGTVERDETVRGSPSCGELSPRRRSAEMISNGRSDANRKVLLKSVGENLLPTAQTGDMSGSNRWGRA